MSRALPPARRSQTSRTARPVQRTAAAAALLLAAGASLTGCGGDEEATPEGGTSASGETVADGPVLNPLTGLELEEQPARPVLTVKMDNSTASAPQVGLSGADLVTEELVEGGITRLAVSYYSEIPKNVGPVRSMRATDIGIVQPLKATLVTSGGAAVTADRINEAGIRVINEKGTGFYREPSRSAPYNLFNKLTEVSDKLKPVDPPEPYLPFSDEGSLPAGKPATGLSAVFSQGHTTSFTFADGVWTNTNSNAADGDTFEPETVLVLRVQVGDAGYTDPAGYAVPETKFTGAGAAQIFHDGEVVTGRWVKDGLDQTISLEVGGEEVTLPAGQVWMELVPAKGGSVQVQR
jgi:hypothetical protein